MTKIETIDIDTIVDQVAKDPKQAKAAKAALKKITSFSEPKKTFSYQRRPSPPELDDDIFDNMPV
ncbi:MAG: hypothetical protein ABJ327_01990 [Litoreibacter sp.]